MAGKRGNLEGSVFKRERDGQWIGKVTVGYKDGKQLRREFTGKTRSEVVARMDAAQQQLSNGQPLLDPKLTVGEFLEWWHKEVLEPSDRGYKTKEYYSSIIRIYLSPYLGKTRLTQLKPNHIEAMLNKAKEKGRSSRTRQAIQRTLHVILGDAEKHRLVHQNVAKLVTVKASKKIEIRPYSPEEAAQLLAATKNDRLNALYVLAITTGLRQAEILGLTWDSVNLDSDNSMVAVRQTLSSRGKNKWAFAPAKTDRSNRVLWLPEMTRQALLEHRGNRTDFEKGTDNLVFTSETGSPLSRHVVYRQFQAIIETAGLRHQRFHDLRHACASYWAAQGMSLHQIMGFLGHSSIALTADLYTHLMPGASQEAASKMDSFFSEVQVG